MNLNSPGHNLTAPSYRRSPPASTRDARSSGVSTAIPQAVESKNFLQMGDQDARKPIKRRTEKQRVRESTRGDIAATDDLIEKTESPRSWSDRR